VKKPGGGGGKGHTGKHAGTHKHHAHGSKHHPSKQPVHGHGGVQQHVHVKAKHHKHARGLAVAPGDLACCAAEAVAASLRLAGWPAGDDDVLALYGLTADATGAGATMLATLEAATEYGVAGKRPRSFGPAPALGPGVILGLALPEGRHFVTDDGESWWSWGEAYCPCCEFPAAVIEEAWEVAW
jgi:hypothetical protein